MFGFWNHLTNVPTILLDHTKYCWSRHHYLMTKDPILPTWSLATSINGLHLPIIHLFHLDEEIKNKDKGINIGDAPHLHLNNLNLKAL